MTRSIILSFGLLAGLFQTGFVYGQASVTSPKLEMGLTASLFKNSTNQSRFNGSNDWQNQRLTDNLSWAAGGYIEKYVNRKWAARAEVQYATVSYVNKKPYDVVSEAEYNLRYLQTNLTVSYLPFWRRRVPFSLFGGAIVQMRAGYKADLLIADPPRRLAWQWETFHTPDAYTKMSQFGLGMQIGAAYQYRQFGVRFSHNRMLNPSLQIDRWSSPSYYYFNSNQLAISYALYRK